MFKYWETYTVYCYHCYDEDELQMIGRVLKERNPNILFGLNKENKEKLKQIKKNYKSATNA